MFTRAASAQLMFSVKHNHSSAAKVISSVEIAVALRERIFVMESNERFAASMMAFSESREEVSLEEKRLGLRYMSSYRESVVNDLLLRIVKFSNAWFISMVNGEGGRVLLVAIEIPNDSSTSLIFC